MTSLFSPRALSCQHRRWRCGSSEQPLLARTDDSGSTRRWCCAGPANRNSIATQAMMRRFPWRWPVTCLPPLVFPATATKGHGVCRWLMMSGLTRLFQQHRRSDFARVVLKKAKPAARITLRPYNARRRASYGVQGRLAQQWPASCA